MRTLALNRQSISKTNVFILALLITILAFTLTNSTREILTLVKQQTIETTRPTVRTTETNKTKLVVSTTIPNVVTNATVQEEIEEEARLQLTLEAEIADQIAYEEEQERLRQLEIARQERIAFIDSVVCDPNDISRVSGLEDISDYKLLTEGTWWEGHEQTLYDLEHTYSVNAMFAMSVSTLESGSGTSVRANSRHNYYGIESSKKWTSLDSNTLYWGGMINRVYVDEGLTSVWTIGAKYCPPNRTWEEFMNSNMQSLYSSLITKMKATVE
jgi:beta-N-acetylglucosaminidase